MVYLAQAGLWTNLNFIILSVLTLLLFILFANLLPREVYGTYQYLLSLSALLTAITLAGMNGAVSQSVARGNEGDLKVAVKVQLRWNLVPTTVGLVGALYYFLQGNKLLGCGLVAIALLAPLWNAFNTYSAFLQGKREFKRLFIYSMIVGGAYYAAIIVTAFFFRNAAILILVNLGMNAAATIFVYFKTLKTYQPNNKTDPHTTSYGAHLSIMNAFGTAMTQFDSLLVFHFLGPVQLAVYSFASMIPERIGGLFGFIGMAALPKFATKTGAEIRATIVSKTVRVCLAALLVAVIYAFAAPYFFRLLFPAYLDAIHYTQIYALVIVFTAGNLANTALLAQRRKAELYITSFVNPLLLVALQIPFLLRWGIMGMLVAKLISDAIGIILTLVLLFRAKSRTQEM